MLLQGILGNVAEGSHTVVQTVDNSSATAKMESGREVRQGRLLHSPGGKDKCQQHGLGIKETLVTPLEKTQWPSAHADD